MNALVIGRTKHDPPGTHSAPSSLLVDWDKIKQPDCLVIKTHYDRVGNIKADMAVTCERNPIFQEQAKVSECPIYWGIREGVNPKQFPEAIAEVTPFAYDSGQYGIWRAIQEGATIIYTIGLDMAYYSDGILKRTRYKGKQDTPWHYYRNMYGLATLCFKYGVQIFKATDESRMPCPVNWPFGGEA